MSRQIIVADDPQDLARRGADILVQRAGSAQGMFSIALSGGNTPRGLYETLARDPYKQEMPWDNWQVFFSDERFVPPDSPESNYFLAETTLLSKVPIPDRFVHRVATVDMDPNESAALYAENIRRIFNAPITQVPHFDVILLGMGKDGHTASLFPDTEALNVEDRLVVANYVPQAGMWRITFTFDLINAARLVLFLVEGADKAPVLARVLSGADLPAAHIQPEGDLIWLVDKAAASDLSSAHLAGDTDPHRNPAR